uniref:Uncharacterized protein n=1 Tax=Pseudomonas fluorescens TaxID=294 RepID=A0A2S1PJG8_PSEFL|nr:hypothetical protein [Pseudomonas fluorescens]AWH58617.1 Hypothetical protein [Pseudomonas fluorescens]
MKILMVIAVLLLVVGIVKSDVILGIFGAVAVACAGTDALARHFGRQLKTGQRPL